MKGQIEPQGAKNEVLQIICASLLTDEDVLIENVPEIRDAIKLIETLRMLDVLVEKLASGKYLFNASRVNIEKLKSPEYTQKAASLRGSIMILGPMLARFGHGFMPMPGGDKIGRRRVDTHFIGFEKLGATYEFDVQNS